MQDEVNIVILLDKNAYTSKLGSDIATKCRIWKGVAYSPLHTNLD